MSQIGGLKFQIDQTHLRSLLNAQEKMAAATPQPAQEGGFAARIEEGLKSVANAQTQASEIAKAYEMGLENDLSKVMIQQQVSSLGFQLTLNVRNKALSAYKDIMNMPV